jgi:hypothetical protein
MVRALAKIIKLEQDPDDVEEESRPQKKKRSATSDHALEQLYDDSSARILQERNDFFLPQIRDFVASKKWVNLRPEYQRRHRWDRKKQSRLIESLLMNVPVPPIFLFEWELNRYEVMDGQQRLTSLIDFYENNLELTGLDAWVGLNGRRHNDLPPKLKRGLDRRRVSAVILLAESVSSKETSSIDIRREVFERLNTGGTPLNHQELRNCLYAGTFNQLIIRLASLPTFRKLWSIPNTKINKKGFIPSDLNENKLFQTMADCQIVLRFFAFRRAAAIKGSVRRMLDNCMLENQHAPPDVIRKMESDFVARLNLTSKIFGNDAFVLPNEQKHSRPLSDAMMIAIDRLWVHKTKLLAAKDKLQEKRNYLLRRESSYEIVVGRPNTALAVKARIDLVEKSFKSVIR